MILVCISALARNSIATLVMPVNAVFLKLEDNMHYDGLFYIEAQQDDMRFAQTRNERSVILAMKAIVQALYASASQNSTGGRPSPPVETSQHAIFPHFTVLHPLRQHRKTIEVPSVPEDAKQGRSCLARSKPLTSSPRTRPAPHLCQGIHMLGTLASCELKMGRLLQLCYRKGPK